ncbi:helix-turn-helix domain-containing protein [Acetobacter senegalensis]|uniref:helix-turn-helix domain-containing protein n=1 Tax=Acetobacter senegalensis TaxID=446692 RepID=UPI0009EED0B2|nr:helix-turn-helix transcriptional regulator [Acetobacter senegalensis]
MNCDPPLIQKKFGNGVRKRRKLLGMSQEELADACDLDRTYIGGVERGERNVSLVNIHRISIALSVSLSELFCDV